MAAQRPEEFNASAYRGSVVQLRRVLDEFRRKHDAGQRGLEHNGHLRPYRPRAAGEVEDDSRADRALMKVAERLSRVGQQGSDRQATRIPEPLVVDGMAPGTEGLGRLRVHPAFNGTQHYEVAGMRYTISGIFPEWLAQRIKWLGWPVKPREVPPGTLVHPSVRQRFGLTEVAQCADTGAYRPEALKDHADFKADYLPAAASAAAVSTPDFG